MDKKTKKYLEKVIRIIEDQMVCLEDIPYEKRNITEKRHIEFLSGRIDGIYLVLSALGYKRTGSYGKDVAIEKRLMGRYYRDEFENA